MTEARRNFDFMLNHCKEKPMYWHHTGFIVKVINGEYVIENNTTTTMPKYIKFFEHHNLLPGFLYTDFWQ